MTKYYINGFYTSHQPNSIEITDAYWLELLEGQAEGKIITPDPTGYPVLTIPADTRTYAQKRADEYPNLGDIIDAMFKAQSGDNDELNALTTLRENIKDKYPKV